MTSNTNQHWSNTDFSKHNFSNYSFVNCRFSNCELIRTNFSNSSFVNCNFSNCDLDDSDFRNSSFMNCRFSNCDVPRANFTGASLTNTSFSNTDTENAVGLNLEPTTSSSSGVSTSFQNNGSVTVQSGTSNFGTVNGFVGGSVVSSGGSSVRLTNGGISQMPFDPWVRIYNGQPSYRIEGPGVNIQVSGTYTFENNERFIHVASTPFGVLNVNIGTIVAGKYQESCSWELSDVEWCEIFPVNFTEEFVVNEEANTSHPNPSSFGGTKYGSGVFHREIT